MLDEVLGTHVVRRRSLEDVRDGPHAINETHLVEVRATAGLRGGHRIELTRRAVEQRLLA